MSITPQITEEQAKHIQPMIVDAVYGTNVMLNFFKQNNLIEPIPKGLLSYEYFDWKEMETGKMGSGIQDLPVVHPVLGKTTLQIVYFGLKVEIGFRVVDNWRNSINPRIGTNKDILTEALRQAVKPMNRTISSFLAYGDDNIYLRDDDPLRGQGKFFGMFNQGQIFAAGAGGDDIMHAFNDYQATSAKATGLLEENEFRKKTYLIMSDKNTHEDAQAGNAAVHINPNGKSERDIQLERKDIAGWAYSSRWYPYSAGYPTTKESRILYTTPTTPEGNKAYRLLQGYNFDIVRANGGNVNDNFKYVVGIFWCGVFDPIIKDSNDKCKAILVSGALDFDG